MLRRPSSSTPACGRRGERRSCCASWWTPSARSAVAPSGRIGAPRRAHRRADGRHARSGCGCGGLPEHAGASRAGASPILERGDLAPGRAARRARATTRRPRRPTLLAAAGILEPGRPLAFVHPIVRSGHLPRAVERRALARAIGARLALLAEQPGANERVAEHLLVSEPAGDALGRRAPRRGRARRDAQRRARVGRGVPAPRARRAAAAADQPGLLLELGMAEASAGLADWAEHLQRGGRGRGRVHAAAAAASMALALALSRAPAASPRRWRCSTARSSALADPDSRARAAARGRGRWRGHERRGDGADRRARGARRCASARRRGPGGAARAARGGRVHLGAHERAGRGRRRARDARARRRPRSHDPEPRGGRGSRSRRGSRRPRSR